MQTFKSPPAAVKIVMEAVCVCLDVKPTLVPDPNMAGEWAARDSDRRPLWASSN